jgi:putative DNA-invertase from lambdoid prophage Rac
VLGRPAKLTPEQKRTVLARLGEGASISALAREFAVSRLTIQRTRDGARPQNQGAS